MCSDLCQGWCSHRVRTNSGPLTTAPWKGLQIERADARTRTGDPFITRGRRLRDGRPRAGTRGHVLAGNWAVLELLGWTRVPARARAHVPVLYPRCVVNSVGEEKPARLDEGHAGSSEISDGRARRDRWLVPRGRVSRASRCRRLLRGGGR